jgi:CMP-N-acetylneuraminic acid synthetase
MNNPKITAFLPCRKGSQRVPKKNIKPFVDFEFGLIQIKLKQLIEACNVDKIVLSTNDDEILDYAASLQSDKIIPHKRVELLSSSETSTDDLVAHALDLIPQGHILWTHVTSPFVNAQLYDKIIQQYRTALLDDYDSLMTTNLIHGFLWDENGPINYDRTLEKWPRTQTIKPLYEINSAVFLSSSENYYNLNDRIGEKPFLYVLDKIQSFDIDWEEDYKIAEMIQIKGED